MTTSTTISDIAVNPGNLAQRYVLWSNGRIDSVGGAPTITSSTTWYDRTDQPVGVALWISNWATGAGYVLDYTGKFNPINGAAALGTGGYVTGVAQSNTRKYVDWDWDPSGSGKGYVVDLWGQLYAFGGATPVARTGPRWGHPVCKRMQSNWTGSVKIILLDQYGGLWADGAAVIGGSGAGILLWPGWDAARDFVVLDWTTGKGYVLDLYGGHTAWGGAVVINGFPFKNGVDCGRRHYCLDGTLLIFWVIWDGGILVEFTNATAPTVIAGAGTNEVQTIAITGATAGTFTVVFGGVTSGTIAFNATAATVQTTLRAMSSIGSTGVTVTGGPGPSTAWTITFAGTLAATNVAQFTLGTNSLTGGTPAFATTTQGINGTPAATTTTTCRPTLAWSYSDIHSLTQAKWQLYVYTSTFAGAHDMTDPSVWASSAEYTATGTQPSQRGIVASHDFPNGTYVVFIRAENYVGLWSAWSNYTWTQNVTPPPAPVPFTAVADNVNFLVKLTAVCSLGVADSVTFQYSDDLGATWNEVRGAEIVPILATTIAYDYDAPLSGQPRLYRSYTFKASPRFISAASPTASATMVNQKYVLTSTADPTIGGEVFVKNAPKWSRTSASGVFGGVEAEYPVVVSDGVPKARKQTITVEADGHTQWVLLKKLIESDSTLLFRDPFGDAMYCRIVGDVGREQQWKRAYPGESSPLRHNHLLDIPLQEVQPPLVLDVGYTIPPGPVVPTIT